MAEVRKKTNKEKYDIEEIKEELEKETKKNTKKKETSKKEKDKKNTSKNKSKKTIKKEKKSLWTRFRIFCHGVKSETASVHWTNKKDMVKYSIATIFFIIFCAIFFYIIEILFALIQSIFM